MYRSLQSITENRQNWACGRMDIPRPHRTITNRHEKREPSLPCCAQHAFRRLLSKAAIASQMFRQRNSATANSCPAAVRKRPLLAAAVCYCVRIQQVVVCCSRSTTDCSYDRCIATVYCFFRYRQQHQQQSA